MQLYNYALRFFYYEWFSCCIRGKREIIFCELFFANRIGALCIIIGSYSIIQGKFHVIIFGYYARLKVCHAWSFSLYEVAFSLSPGASSQMRKEVSKRGLRYSRKRETFVS